MKRTVGFPRIFLASLFVMLMTAAFLDAAMIPIADGNTWVYKYSDTLKMSAGPAFIVISGKEGLFTMQMDSVIIVSDTIFFTMTTIDSGITNRGSLYNNRSVKKYMVTSGMLFLQDTATGSWFFSSDRNITFMPPGDTSYSWCAGWYGKITEGFDTTIQCNRYTDSSAVVVNGKNMSQLFTTDTSFFWLTVGFDTILGGSYDTISDISRMDTLQWLDNMGMFYHAYEYIDKGSSSVQTISTFAEKYSLLSFNGTPVSITPAAKVKNIVFAASQIPSDRNRKVIWLGASPYRQPDPARYHNLLGRQLKGIERAQLLIKKEELPSTGR